MPERIAQRFGEHLVPGSRGRRTLLRARQLVANAEMRAEYRHCIATHRPMRSRGQRADTPVQSKGFGYRSENQETHRPRRPLSSALTCEANLKLWPSSA